MKGKCDLNDCVDTRAYCADMMARWFNLRDCAQYLSAEHQQKEREYGITWRSAFKQQLNKKTNELSVKLTGSGIAEDQDPFDVLYQLVVKDYDDVRQFDEKCQADLICMLAENLRNLSITIYTLKKLLKQPDQTSFHVCEKEIEDRFKE